MNTTKTNPHISTCKSIVNKLEHEINYLSKNNGNINDVINKQASVVQLYKDIISAYMRERDIENVMAYIEKAKQNVEEILQYAPNNEKLKKYHNETIQSLDDTSNFVYVISTIQKEHSNMGESSGDKKITKIILNVPAQDHVDNSEDSNEEKIRDYVKSLIHGPEKKIADELEEKHESVGLQSMPHMTIPYDKDLVEKKPKFIAEVYARTKIPNKETVSANPQPELEKAEHLTNFTNL